MNSNAIENITAGFGRFLGIVGAAAAIGVLGIVPVSAQNNKGAAAAAAAPAFGSVDLQRVFAEYKSGVDDVNKLKAQQQRLSRVLEQLRQSSALLVSAEEIREMAGLYEKPTLSDADKQRLQVLEQKANSTGEELTRLQSTAGPDDAQKKRLADLTAAQEKGAATLQQLQQDYQTRMDQDLRNLDQRATKTIREAVAKLAQEKGLSLVFDANVVLYAQTDLTEDLLKALNKGK